MAVVNIHIAFNSALWTLVGITTACLILRLYARAFVRKSAGFDDLVVLIAGLHNIASACTLSVAMHYGTGTHTNDIAPGSLSKAVHLNLIATVMAVLDIFLPKVSVAILIVRLLEPKKQIAVSLIGSSLFMVLVAVTTTVLTFAQCTPIDGQWNDLQRIHTECLPPYVLTDFSIFAGSLAVVGDFAFAVFPAVYLVRLKMTLGKKVCMVILMGLGVVAGVVGSYKMSVLPGLALRDDITYTTAEVLFWTNVEANACLIAACLPVLHTYKSVIKSWLENRKKKKKRNSDDAQSGRNSSWHELQPKRPSIQKVHLEDADGDDNSLSIAKQVDIYTTYESSN